MLKELAKLKAMIGEGGGGGGGGTMVVTFTLDMSTGEYHADKPFETVWEALRSGVPAVARTDMEFSGIVTGGYYSEVVYANAAASDVPGKRLIAFAHIAALAGAAQVATFKYYDDESVVQVTTKLTVSSDS